MKAQARKVLPVLAVVAAMLGMTLSLANAEDEKVDQSKGFWVENQMVDVGKVKAGDDAVATFVFHNDTDKEVKIIRAKPS